MTEMQSQHSIIASPIGSRLTALAESDKSRGIKQKFSDDSERVNRFSFDHRDVLYDFSKTHISAELVQCYLDFAEEINFTQRRLSLFAGERINNSENRSVLHALLRDETNQAIEMAAPKAIVEAAQSKAQFIARYDQIQSELAKRSTPVENIIHVGIGGSSLGTQLIFEALKDLGATISVHFVGNIDGHQLVDVLAKCQVDNTLVIGVSKTFTTAETLQNLNSIAAWFSRHGVENPLTNFYGVTAAPQKAVEYGLCEVNTVAFPEWVGGRYSVWSSVSLSAALVIGMHKFEELLAGAASMDQHFYRSDLSENLPFLSAALDHYYTNFLDVKSRAIFAYDFRLRSLVDYLQQLETESNGKDRQRDGAAVDQQTSPVVWGGVGTDVQHSVFQMLHQGTALIPSEFILVKKPDHDLLMHHKELLANGLAQPAALLAGQNYAEVEQRHAHENLSELTKKAKIFSGDRPSTTILIERLSPLSLGALLAFYEHRTFCFGVFANINSYDQMGVELGKRLAKQVKPLLSDGQAQKSADEFDSSTLSVLRRIISD